MYSKPFSAFPLLRPYQTPFITSYMPTPSAVFRATLLVLLLLVAPLLWAAPPEGYRYEIDLVNTENDRVSIVLYPPADLRGTVEFVMPRIVPGTYSISDFGRFIRQVAFLDSAGNELTATSLDVNRWQVEQGERIARVRYEAEDSWDTPVGRNVFEPAGSHIIHHKVVLFNPFAFCGFFKGWELRPFELTFSLTAEMEGASALKPVLKTPVRETYQVSDYNHLAASPILFAVPDTATFQIGDVEIIVAVSAERFKAAEVAPILKTLLEAQKSYLGGRLPVDRYAFLFCMVRGMTGSGMMGALEHPTSSVYVLPDLPAALISHSVKEIAAHEFFHILTPLNIRSEQVRFFDFTQPVLSQHLWLYEGVVEYFAGHMLAHEKLVEPEVFLEWVSGKIQSAANYQDDLPFTRMSVESAGKYHDQYGNVYEKGALIGVCLDLLLRKNNYSLPALMSDLAARYGPDRHFADSLLFGEIADMAADRLPAEWERVRAQIMDFFERHVDGREALPVKELLADAGICLEGAMTYLVVEDRYEIFFDDNGNLILYPMAVGQGSSDPLLKKGEAISQIEGQSLQAVRNVSGLPAILRKIVKEDDLYTVRIRKRKGFGSLFSPYRQATWKITTKQGPETELVPCQSPSPTQQALWQNWLNLSDTN